MSFTVSLAQYCGHSPHSSSWKAMKSQWSEMVFCLLMTMLLSGNQKGDARDTVYITLLLDLFVWRKFTLWIIKGLKIQQLWLQDISRSQIFPLKQG